MGFSYFKGMNWLDITREERFFSIAYNYFSNTCFGSLEKFKAKWGGDIVFLICGIWGNHKAKCSALKILYTL